MNRTELLSLVASVIASLLISTSTHAQTQHVKVTSADGKKAIEFEFIRYIPATQEVVYRRHGAPRPMTSKLSLFSEDSKALILELQRAKEMAVVQAPIQDPTVAQRTPIASNQTGSLSELPARNEPKEGSMHEGIIKGLAIIADFPDQPISEERMAELKRKYSAMELTADGKIQSIKKYYHVLSRGSLTIKTDVVGPIPLPHNAMHYYKLGAKTGAKGQQVSLGRYKALEDCLNHLIASGFDFSPYTKVQSSDPRRDNQLLFLSFVCQARGQRSETGRPDALLFNASTTSLRFGGIKPIEADGVRFSTFFGGSSIHEVAHRVLEWPDLYGVGSQVGPQTGVSTIMSGVWNSTPDPYHMYQTGWLDAENIYGKSGRFSIQCGDVNTAYAYYDPSNPDEYFFIQPMIKSGLFDNRTNDEGLAIWRIYTKGANHVFPKEPLLVEMVHCDGVNADVRGSNVFFKSGQYDAYTADTVASSRWMYGEKAGLDSGLEISDISKVGSTMSFTLHRSSLKTDRVVHFHYRPADSEGWIPTAVCNLPVRTIGGFREINRDAVYKLPDGIESTYRSSILNNFLLSGHDNSLSSFSLPPKSDGENPTIVIRLNEMRQVKHIEVVGKTRSNIDKRRMRNTIASISDDGTQWETVGNVDASEDGRWLVTLSDGVSARFIKLENESGEKLTLGKVFIYGR
ncbi:discoidin domain-containing protein [Novipirellula herctigrandis]